MAISEEKLRTLIMENFPDADLEILDLVGDNDHYQISVRSARFAGKPIVMQHRLVNEALKAYLGDKLHALSIKTNAK